MTNHHIVDDSDIDDRIVAYWIDTQRALLVSQFLEKKRSIPRNLIQDLGCVPVELVDSAECCASLTAGCKVIRTSDQVPIPLVANNKELITHVGSINKTAKPWSLIQYERVPVVGSGRFNGHYNVNYCYYRNGYIYVVYKPDDIFDALIETINIQGVWESPEDVKNYYTCSGVACYSNDDAYPINMRMIDILKQNILQFNIKLFLTVPKDNSNDSEDTQKQQ